MELFLYNIKIQGVISVYEVYLDIFIIDNMMTNLFVLIAVKLLEGGRLKVLRLIAASILGAVISTLMLYYRLSYGLLYILLVIFSDLSKLYILEIYKSRAVTGLIYLNLITLAYSKLNDCIIRLIGRKLSLIVSAMLVIAIVVFTIINKKISKKRTVYKVILRNNDNTYEAKALYDTGNLLTEPITGKPVSIIETNPFIRNWIDNTPEKYKAIPYKSVGNDTGILEGMEIEQLIIHYDNTKAVKDNPIIAIYDGKLSKNNSFNMILNHSLIE
jgi:sigma-E processing peptidase SpoIIGA